MTTNQNQHGAAAAADQASATAPDQGLPAAVSAPAEAYVIPRALAQATLDYLAAQPYREVFALVRAFEALEPLPSDAVPAARR